jgi:predicted outer membrane protein
MMLAVAAVLFAADLGLANASGKTLAMQKSVVSDAIPDGPARTTPPARDPSIAVEEEFELARKRGTSEALELFILRHPDDPFAEEARRLIKARLKRDNR